MDTQKQPEELPSTSDFYLNTGLYKEYEITAINKPLTFKIIFTKETLDCYCISCAANSIFKPNENRELAPNRNSSIVSNNPLNRSDNDYMNHNTWNINPFQNVALYKKTFSCSRNPLHQLYFNILVNKGKLLKIGQFPSYADIYGGEVEKYKPILGKYFGEFTKAIGLYSHGSAIGGFVYLRRIIENFIIAHAIIEAKTKPSWDDDKFEKARVKDKIKLLKDELPFFFVENAKIYSILSAGIHELKEDECKEYFNVLKESVLLVLAKIKEEKEKKLHEQKLKLEIDKIQKDIESNKFSK